jgi:hypothetical protein
VVLSLKRYRRSLPLGPETDKIVTSRNVLRGVGAEWLLPPHRARSVFFLGTKNRKRAFCKLHVTFLCPDRSRGQGFFIAQKQQKEPNREERRSGSLARGSSDAAARLSAGVARVAGSGVQSCLTRVMNGANRSVLKSCGAVPMRCSANNRQKPI